MQSGKFLRALGLAAAVALGAAACGGGGGSGDGEGQAQRQADGQLKFGYIFPETGELSHLGPPQVAAAKLAVEDINEADGALGQQVPEIVASDEGGKPEVANQSADRVLGQNVDTVIGPAASGMGLAVIDKITGAGVAQCSGSTTAPTFTDYEDDGLFFRTAPSDVLQGPILADAVMGDGHANVAITFRNDDYGKGLAEATRTALQQAGAQVPVFTGYDPNTTNFQAVTSEITSAQPDAVVMVSFEEGAQLATDLIEGGLDADQMYGADGMRDEEMAEKFSADDPTVISGFQGTAPASVENEDFTNRLEDSAPDLEVLQFAPQVYDCVVTMALAAESAKTDDPNTFKSHVNGVTKDGEKCRTYEECKGLLADGEDIDYDGVSGPLDFTEPGEPGETQIEVYRYDDQGELTNVRTVDSKPVE